MITNIKILNNKIEAFICDFLVNTPLNLINERIALREDLAGLQIFDDALVGFASTSDKLFSDDFKRPDVVGPNHKMPTEWLPNAKSVISFFLPYSKEICDSNSQPNDCPFDESISNQRCSTEWLHGRIEGQQLIDDLCRKLCEYLQSEGYDAITPALSEDFKVFPDKLYSNWSERHAAYAAGLGTFGLSKHIITERGSAGRIGSVITSAEFEATKRPYSNPFENCIMCGACQKKCPVNSIDKERGVIKGKDKFICRDYVQGSYLKPWGADQIVRYGCGKCSVHVPCEHKNPKNK